MKLTLAVLEKIALGPAAKPPVTLRAMLAHFGYKGNVSSPKQVRSLEERFNCYPVETRITDSGRILRFYKI